MKRRTEMKKILAIFVCAFLMLTFSVVSFAEEGHVDATSQIESDAEKTPSTEASTDEVDTLPPKEETPQENGNIGGFTMPEITTEKIKEYIMLHFEEISVIASIVFMIFYEIRRHRLLNRSIVTLNNNSVEVSKNSELTIQNALARMEGISSDVLGYKNEFTKLLEEYRANEEEKKELEKTLHEAMTYIKTSKLANIEFADELAELLVLANIPNSKKDELYSRHVAAVDAISEAEKTEVKPDEGGHEA
jgi:hypothetical protein